MLNTSLAIKNEILLTMLLPMPPKLFHLQKPYPSTLNWVGLYQKLTIRVFVKEMISDKVIHKKIWFIDEFLDSHSKADLEDLFAKGDYLKLLNQAFSEHKNTESTDLDTNIQRMF